MNPAFCLHLLTEIRIDIGKVKAGLIRNRTLPIMHSRHLENQEITFVIYYNLFITYPFTLPSATPAIMYLDRSRYTTISGSTVSDSPR